MKKIVVLVAAAAGVAWAVSKKAAPDSAQKKAKSDDAWAKASDRV
jgi:hypothetical protein